MRVGLALAAVMAMATPRNTISSAHAHSLPAQTCALSITHGAAAAMGGTDPVCAALPISAALQQVGVAEKKAQKVARTMAALDLESVLDLRLLAAAEVEELLREELRETANVSIGTRSKVRLLASTTDTNDQAQAHRSHRNLQENAGGGDSAGVSIDTIAIVLSVFVGAAGYIIQAISARKADQAAEARQHELQQAETRRDREHEQMQAQIKRTERIVDDCCGPAIANADMVVFNIVSFIDECLVLMETEHPDVVSHLNAAICPAYNVAEDGTITGKATGVLVREGQPAKALLKKKTFFTRWSTETSAMICPVCILMVRSAGFIEVLPSTILQLIAADADAKLAVRYRRFVTITLLPQMIEVYRILQEHSTVIQPPAKDWLVAKFPDEMWSLLGEHTYLGTFMNTVTEWKRLVAHWTDGDFSDCVPACPCSHIPLGGLVESLRWSMDHGKALQKELIGMAKEDNEKVQEAYDGIMSSVAANT